MGGSVYSGSAWMLSGSGLAATWQKEAVAWQRLGSGQASWIGQLRSASTQRVRGALALRLHPGLPPGLERLRCWRYGGSKDDQVWRKTYPGQDFIVLKSLLGQ